MKLSLLIDHIKATVPTVKGHVQGIIGLAEIGNSSPSLDQQCFVLPLKESAGGNMIDTMAVRQRVTTVIGVAVSIRNVRDARGEASHDGGLDAVRTELMSAIQGWTPLDMYGVFTYAGGELLRMEAGAVIWLFRFQTEHYESSI